MKYLIVYAMLLASILSLFFVVTVISDEESNQWIVSNDGNGDFSSIQSAVNAASHGDTIIIQDGVYSGTVFLNKSIHFTGINTSFCVIDGMNKEGIVINADDVVLSNCTIQNASLGIRVNGSQIIVRNCTIRDNHQGMIIDYFVNSTLIYYNNFVNNVEQCIDLGTRIYWNSTTIGNYWDTYDGSDTNHDGIGDTPFNITNDTNKDYFPLMKPVTRSPSATFSFSPTIITTETEVVFTDTSFDPDGVIISHLWDFGDGNTSTSINTSHVFSKSGQYNVSLMVTDNLGMNNTYILEITVHNIPPKASFSFSPSNPTDVEQVTFSDTSVDTDGSIINWTWDFGDNTTSFDQHPLHRFPDNGSFTVLLTVEDDNGDIDSYNQNIVVSNVAPVAEFSFSFSNVTALINQPIQFKDSSVDLDGTIISRQWDFDDGTLSTDRNPTHIYSSKGSYTITLTITDNDGSTNTKSRVMTVSDTIHDNGGNIISEFSLFDIIFVVFLVVMVVLVIILSKKFG